MKAVFELKPYLGYGDQTREFPARKFTVKQSGDWLEIEAEGHEGPFCAIEWTPERGLAVRVYPDNAEPSHQLFILGERVILVDDDNPIYPKE